MVCSVMQEIALKELRLEAHKERALQDLGYGSANQLMEAMAAEPRMFSAYLKLTHGDFQGLQSRMRSLVGTQFAAERSQLEQLPCALGYDIEHSRALRVSAPPPLSSSDLAMEGVPPPTSATVDLTPTMPPIRNQGGRGTCVAFATVRCMEFARRPPGVQTDYVYDDLSPQYLYWYIKEFDQEPSEGSSIWAGAQTAFDQGTCLETSHPYHPTPYREEDAPQRGPKPPANLDTEAARHRPDIAEDLSPNDVDALKMVLSKGIPISYGIPIFRSWYYSTYTRATGKVTLPIGSDVTKGGHAIVLTGYVTDQTFPGGGYFIFDNSWGTEWAAKGPHGGGRGLLPFKYANLYGGEAAYLSNELPETAT